MHHRSLRSLRSIGAFAVALGLLQPLRLAGQQPASTTSLVAKLGFVSTAGNARQTTLNFGDKLTQTYDKLALIQEFQSIFSRNDSVTIGNYLSAALRAKYTLTPRLAPLVYVSWERDVPSGLTQRLEEGAALAYQVPTDPSDTLSIALGPTLVQERRAGKPDNSFAAGRTALAYRHHFSSKATFDQLVEYLPDLSQSSNYRVNTETALAAPVAGHLALDVSYKVRYANLPPAGRIRADRYLTAGIQFTM